MTTPQRLITNAIERQKKAPYRVIEGTSIVPSAVWAGNKRITGGSTLEHAHQVCDALNGYPMALEYIQASQNVTDCLEDICSQEVEDIWDKQESTFKALTDKLEEQENERGD